MGGFWDPSWAPTSMFHPGFFTRQLQEASKRLPRAPRTPQERLQGAPRASKRVPRASESNQNVARERPRCQQKGTFDALLRFLCFCVFQRFSTFFFAFFCVFIGFSMFPVILLSSFRFFSVCVCRSRGIRSHNAQESPKSCFDMVMSKQLLGLS